MGSALCDEWVEAPCALRAIAETVEMVVEDLDAPRVAAPVMFDSDVDPEHVASSPTVVVEEYARAVLYNGFRHYQAARVAARRACSRDDFPLLAAALAELVEASVRCAGYDEARQALGRLEAWTASTTSPWASGLANCCRALIDGVDEIEGVDAGFTEAIALLSEARALVAAARARLLYGEWLRRHGRRVDARRHLTIAQAVFEHAGLDGFADRTRREALATGEHPRRRTDDTRLDLTPQEAHIARLAGEGRTNAEIGEELYLSPRTVEWHLRKVFTKLEITSRRDLREWVPTRIREPEPPIPSCAPTGWTA